MKSFNINLEQLENKTLDLGNSSSRNIYPTIQFASEEFERLENFSNRVGFKKGTIVQVAVRKFLKKLNKGEI